MIRKFVFMVFAALMISACVENTETTDTCRRMTFTASTGTDDTRTVLVDRVKVYWEDGDEIAVSGAQEPFVTSLDEPSRSASFEGEAEVADTYHAVYPYSCLVEWEDGLAVLNLQQTQPAMTGTFGPGINISVSSTTDQDKDFYFRNVLGYVKFTVGPETGDITSVTVSANAGESLSGDFYVECFSDNPKVLPDGGPASVSLVSEKPFAAGDYYIAMLPGIYEEGLTFTFEGPDGTAVKTVGTPLTLERGHINAVNISGLEWTAEETYYVKVSQQYDDWSGEYLITYDDGSSIVVFNSWEGSDKGASTKDLYSCMTSDGISSEDGDPYKAVIGKVGDSYSIHVSGVGYLGCPSGSKNTLSKQDAAPSSGDTQFLWNFSYKSGSLWISNASYTSRRLQWNTGASIFRCYTGGQEDLTLYRKTGSSGSGSQQPDPDPTPDPTPEPDPDPEPDPTPDPTPQPGEGTSGKYGWYELPVMNLKTSGDYLVDADDQNLYFAYHMCAGSEKGPGGRKARNYTVCYSAEHHCPVWVAAPRHSMYEGSANRTNAYGKDPDIPASIQYSSKDTGGGCNKGHMLGSAERTSSTATNKQVFYYTNIAPQYSDTFNTGGGGWNTLEDWVDGKVCSDTLYVVIGAYFENYTDRRGYTDSPKTISFGGRSDVTRPSMYYYILMRTKKGNTGKALSECTSDEIMCAAFVRSHATPKKTAVGEKDMMSVSDLEKLTGFTYFPNVPQAPKDTYKASDWGL